MNTRMLLTVLAALPLTGCVVSFAPPAAAVPSATAIAIAAQRHEGLVALETDGASPGSAAVDAVVVAAVR